MSKKEIDINTGNLNEWIRSTGYFLPETDQELLRFEKLYPRVERQVDDNRVDPIAIINGTWNSQTIKLTDQDNSLNEEIVQLKMAARKYTNLPEHIVNKIKKNQADNDESDNT